MHGGIEVRRLFGDPFTELLERIVHGIGVSYASDSLRDAFVESTGRVPMMRNPPSDCLDGRVDTAQD